MNKQANNDKLTYYMVGDSPSSDILGGNQNGFETILVKTGNYKDGMDPHNAKYIVDDVYDAVNKVLKYHY